MKGSGNIISIDGEKLAQEIAARKITKVDASKKIGFSHSYIAGCCSNGRISKAAAIAEAKRFSAKYAQYKELAEIFEAIETVSERIKAS